MRDAISHADTLIPSAYTAADYQRVATARARAASLVNTRIYSIAGVNDVKAATNELNAAIDALTVNTAPASLPEVPAAGLLPLAGVMVLGAAGYRRRRRGRALS